MLRDFWFPILLTAGSVVPGFLSFYAADGNGRRVLWTITVTLWFAAILSFVWGDPVRGPFAKLLHPKASNTFTVHAGFAAPRPISELKDGITFSQHVIQSDGLLPLDFTISRRWLTGLKYHIVLKQPNGRDIRITSNGGVENVPSGWDWNADDNAVEVVDDQRQVVFQLVQDGNYDVHVNAVLISGDGKADVMNGDSYHGGIPPSEIAPGDRPERLFRYPRYAHRGVRD